MANILLFSPTEAVVADLSEQIKLYAPEFVIYHRWCDDVVFDLALVDEDWNYALNLHARLYQTPIIFLGTPNDDVPDSIRCLARPLPLELLLDVLQSATNVFARGEVGIIDFCGQRLNLGNREITSIASGRKVKLTEREVAVLTYLYKLQGKTVSKGDLLSKVWGYSPDTDTHTIETHIYRLRQKIEEDEPIINTEENGYSLNIQID